MKQADTIFTGTQPLYQQCKDYILARILSGEWPEGRRIPSENKLTGALSISRMTINRALRELMLEGYLSRVHGVGTFVKAAPRRASLLELRNIADEIADRGHRHSCSVVVRQEVAAAPGLAQRFALEAGAGLYHTVLVHCEDGTPVQVEDRYVNPDVAPDYLVQSFAGITPTEYLIKVAPPSELEHVVKAILPGPQHQDLLDIGPMEPCLVLHRRSWSAGRVAAIATLTYPACRYELSGRYHISQAGTMPGRAARGARPGTPSGKVEQKDNAS